MKSEKEWSEESRYTRLVWNKKKTSFRYTLNPIFMNESKLKSINYGIR